MNGVDSMYKVAGEFCGAHMEYLGGEFGYVNAEPNIAKGVALFVGKHVFVQKTLELLGEGNTEILHARWSFSAGAKVLGYLPITQLAIGMLNLVSAGANVRDKDYVVAGRLALRGTMEICGLTTALILLDIAASAFGAIGLHYLLAKHKELSTEKSKTPTAVVKLGPNTAALVKFFSEGKQTVPVPVGK